ncbi:MULTISPECIES: efflux RND transporter permease subunit [Myxococcus]|uniref:efflux RND transporter permease subunit n=1 Tax=Myxococcus TaxID=32 RepID=UPI001126B97E|nr:efflux RND transporter permease subunit [Myxococcus sp. NMCA1]
MTRASAASSPPTFRERLSDTGRATALAALEGTPHPLILSRSAELSGQAAPGVSLGRALAAMQERAAQVSPPGTSTARSGLLLEQQERGGQPLVLFGLGLLLAFLVLSAQYESFTLPLVVILSVPLGLPGALGLHDACLPTTSQRLLAASGRSSSASDSSACLQGLSPHRRVVVGDGGAYFSS